MAHKINLEKTSAVTSVILNPILINQTETTRRALLCTVVDNPKDPSACISGTIVHQRKRRNQSWETVEYPPLSTLKAGESVPMHFTCSQLKNLRDALAKAYTIGDQGVLPTDEYLFGTKDELIATDKDKKGYVQKLLEQNYGEEIWEQLVETNPDLATKLSYARIHSDRMLALQEFEASIHADLQEAYWQRYLSKNDWIFGYGLSYVMLSVMTDQIYVGGKDVQGAKGRVGDFLAASNGDARFTVLIEIKKPNTPLLDRQDRNRSYPVSKELSMAVSQIQGYCDSWARNPSEEKFDFENSNDLITVQPKGYIVIGNTLELDTKDKKRSFELFRRNLNNPEIITYDELLARARYILQDKSSPQFFVEEDDNELPF